MGHEQVESPGRAQGIAPTIPSSSMGETIHCARPGTPPLLTRTIVPAIAGTVMLVATFLPWLTDPVDGNATAWRLPLDIVWQFHIGIVNYGSLCACCAVYLWLVAYTNIRELPITVPYRVSFAGVLCLLPFALLIVQYTCIDVAGITTLAQHKIQVLLIQSHYGYGAPADRITQHPFDVSAATLQGRLILLVNQVAIGALLPLIAVWVLLDYGRREVLSTNRVRDVQNKRWHWLVVVCATIILLGCGIVATLCDYEAKLLLSSGSYAPALGWLDIAHALNPAFEQVPSYHIQRGQALYFLHPNQESDDSRIYLAWVYRGQHDYLDAYQELLPVWQAHRHTTWVVSEMDTTLEYLSEYTKYLNGPVVKRPENDDTALRWLIQVTYVDSSNVYGQYQVGRIQCDLHNYAVCTAYMLTTLYLSNNADVQSSAYTYIGLSDIGLGDYARGRDLLFQAVRLDTDYRNNTAREELSGLH